MKVHKIIVDTQMLSRPEKTGMGRYINELLPLLMEYKEFEWIKKQPRSIKFYRTIWEHIVLPFSTLFSGADILFCPSNIAPIYLPRKVKLVVTIHDVRVKVFPDTFSKGTRMYYEFIYNFVFKRADVIITVSEFSKNEIIKYFPEVKNKLHVIPNGINLNRFKFQNTERKKQILFIGAISKHKNIGIILDAFSRVMNKIPHNLVIVGNRDSGMPQDDKIQQVLSLIPRDRITFTGKISDEDVVRIYNESDFFVFPSLYEGFGLPILEAMACGCPVIASNVASIPEVCGDSAILFDPFSPEELANKILQLALDEEIKEELRQKGLERVKAFSWGEVAKKYIEIFNKIAYE